MHAHAGSGVRLEFYDVPPEVEKALKPVLLRWLGLLPTWCHSLAVFYRPDESGMLANEAKPEYRTVRLLVSGKWLDEPAWNRDAGVRHELLHAALAPMVHFTWAILDKFVEDETTNAALREQWRLAFEGAVVDLEHAVGVVAR